MANELAAAAASDGQAGLPAPAESEQATPNAGVPNEADAAPENAENKVQEEQQPEADGDDKPTKLTRNQRLQRKAARLATMLAEKDAEIEELRKKSQSGSSDAPKPSDYAQGEYDPGYLSDLAAHKAASKISETLGERDKRATAEKIAQARQEAAEEFLERAEEIKVGIPDFDATFETFGKAGGTFAPHVIEELHESEHGPLLAYQLAKNPQLAATLNTLSPRDAAREIGRLEAKLSLPQPKKQTQAPAPLRQPAGGASPTQSLEQLAKTGNMDAYVRLRDEQEKARRR